MTIKNADKIDQLSNIDLIIEYRFACITADRLDTQIEDRNEDTYREAVGYRDRLEQCLIKRLKHI